MFDKKALHRNEITGEFEEGISKHDLETKVENAFGEIRENDSFEGNGVHFQDDQPFKNDEKPQKINEIFYQHYESKDLV